MWMQISAGLAPIESCRFVYLFLNQVEKECADTDVKITKIDCTLGDKKATLKSVLLKLEGPKAKEYVMQNKGTMKWVCKSPYRPNHRRKNWFIDVEIFDENTEISFDQRDIKIETMRCSGNGGQNVNKLETGVRITHLPTGITAKAMEERSQHQNKKLALARLDVMISDLNKDNANEKQRELWTKHKTVERGNEVRTFKGMNFKSIK